MAQNKKAKTSSIAEMEVAICRDLLTQMREFELQFRSKQNDCLEHQKSFDAVAKELAVMSLVNRAKFRNLREEFNELFYVAVQGKPLRMFDQELPALREEFERVKAGTAVGSVLVGKLRIFKTEAIDTMQLVERAEHRAKELGVMVSKL